jgi:AraC-like DNA-binding protein
MTNLTSLLGRKAFSSRVFFNASYCGSNRLAHRGGAGQLHLVFDGAVHFIHDGLSKLVVDQPSLVFYPQGTAHTLSVPGECAARLLCADVQFEGGAGSALSLALPAVQVLAFRDAPALAPLVRLIRSEMADGGNGQEVVLDRLCDILVVHAIRHGAATGEIAAGTLSGLLDERLGRVLHAVHSQPALPWRLDTLAELAGMSRSKFASYFHEVVGMPPGDYLQQRRLRLAMELLAQGMPVKAVCHETGYSNQSAFTRMFTERTGIPPSRWRSRQQE